MTALPSGTVTFLFTDIEDSTRLWDEHPDSMSMAQADHDRLLRSAINSADGYVFSSAGDGVGAAFVTPVDALRVATSLQDALGRMAWPSQLGSIRVRMGIHTGQTVERDGDYFGTAVNKAARVSSAASGGQILVSDAVRTMILDSPANEWQFADLGEHSLKGLVRPERLWQVVSEDTGDAVTPVRTGRRDGNLPESRREIFGRGEDAAAIAGLVLADPLVTLTGVGGVGKTTLARMVGRMVADRFDGGVWFVDLTPMDEPEMLAGHLASTIGVTQRPGMTIEESLMDALRLAPHLLIVDNAEHLVDEVAALVDSLLGAAPHLRLIVTSREALAIDGERVRPVEPLELVGGASAPAVELFVERVRRLVPEFVPTSDDVDAIVGIVTRVDGLPLGIELAAAQCELLSPREVLSGLESTALALRSHSRSGVARHESLAEAIAWSFDRLDLPGRSVFRRLSVFAGGCSVGAAVDVCGQGLDGVDESLRALARTSMIKITRRSSGSRIRLLETLREFAAGQLADAGEVDGTRARHAEYFAAKSASVKPALAGPREPEYLDWIRTNLDNIRVAVMWAREHRPELVADLVAPLSGLIEVGPRPEVLDWMTEVLEALPDHDAARLTLAEAKCLTSQITGQYAASPEWYAAETAGFAGDPDRELMGKALTLVTATYLGDMEAVLADSPEVLEEAYERDVARVIGPTATDFALAQLVVGDREGARATAARMMAYAREKGAPSLIAWASYTSGEIAGEDDVEGALATLEEGVELGYSVGNEFVTGLSLIALSSIAGRAGRYDVALDGMAQGLDLWPLSGNRTNFWTALRNLIETLVALGLDEEALALHAAIDPADAPALFGVHGDRYLACVEQVVQRLGPRAGHARAIGEGLGYAGAIDFARQAIVVARGVAASLDAAE